MNPGKLNHRLKFSTESVAISSSGGQTVTLVPLNLSDTLPNDVTWGSMEPIKQWDMIAIQAGGTAMTSDRVAVIRYRSQFGSSINQFFKAVIIEDLNNPGVKYTFHSVLPYQPGSKSTFQNTDQQVYKDRVYVFMLLKVRD